MRCRDNDVETRGTYENFQRNPIPLVMTIVADGLCTCYAIKPGCQRLIRLAKTAERRVHTRQ